MPLCEVPTLADKVYDYIIVGAGTAGSALASRLSENPSVSVLVLEAGPANFDDPYILKARHTTQTFKMPQYDWDFTTVKQKYSNDREIYWARGKGIGGSSAMNFYCWVKPPAHDVDAFEQLGNKGWNWNDYTEYLKKIETYHPGGEKEFQSVTGGTSGPIQVGIPPSDPTLDVLFREGLVNQGLKTLSDPYKGDTVGHWISPLNIDPKTLTRSYAATGYIQPFLDRPNFVICTNALVSRVILSGEGDLVADGVEVVVDDCKFRFNATKEVILCAGAINNPKILELSGVGSQDVLQGINVEQKIDLPGVGKNAQEHHHVALTFKFKGGNTPAASDTVDDEARALTNWSSSIGYFPFSLAAPQTASSIIDALEAQLHAENAKSYSTAQQKQFKLQLATLKDDKQPDCETLLYKGHRGRTTLPEPDRHYVTFFVFVNHPFSRGTIHAQSQDPTVHPAIDPNYFENDFDLTLLVEQCKFIRKMVASEPWASKIEVEADPGPAVSSDEELREFIKGSHSTTWHTVGTCSMLPREDEGVVDSELKVYGTKNLRCADISIIPLHVASHTQTLAYYIGEKAAHIIKSS